MEGKSTPRSPGGFSLFELLLAMIILSSAVLVLAPSLGRIGDRLLLVNEAKTLRNFLESISVLAARSNEEIQIILNQNRLSVSAKSLRIQSRDLRLKHSHSVKLSSTVPSTITYYNGRSVSPTLIVLERNAHRCELSLSLRGRLELRCS